jgi:hypothetical protein
VVGLLAGMWLLPAPRRVGSLTLDVHSLLYSMAAIFLGFQSVLFGVFTKTFAITEGLLPTDPSVDRWYRMITLEKGLLFGGALMIVGIVGSVIAFSDWSGRLFGPLDPSQTMRTVIPSVLFLVLGFETVLSSFFLSVLGLARE